MIQIRTSGSVFGHGLLPAGLRWTVRLLVSRAYARFVPQGMGGGAIQPRHGLAVANVGSRVARMPSLDDNER